MSHRQRNRTHALAIAAARLRRDRLTNRDIAARIGVDAERVAGLVRLGQRLETVEDSARATLR